MLLEILYIIYTVFMNWQWLLLYTVDVMNSCHAICLLYGLNVAFSFIDGLCIKCFYLAVIVDNVWIEAMSCVA